VELEILDLGCQLDTFFQQKPPRSNGATLTSKKLIYSVNKTGIVGLPYHIFSFFFGLKR
jgi:hypothetical protein